MCIRDRVRVVTSHAGFSRDEYRYVDDFRQILADEGFSAGQIDEFQARQ